jgi:minor histocompatibility antigen H13
MRWDGRGPPPAAKAHALLLALTLSPLLVHIPYSVSIVLHAALAVYVGCWRSVKTEPPQESMSDGDAYRFPLVGSCVLFGLFLCFKFLPRNLVNTLLAAYIVSLGAFVVVSTVLPFCERFFPPATREKVVRLPKIPAISLLGITEPILLEPTVPEVVLAVPSIALGLWYFVSKSWLANNLLGLAFSIVGIEALSLGSTKTGAILLAGLFVYDVFWVFCTPVMVSVARNFEAPIKLLFPRTSLRAIKAASLVPGAKSAASNFAMLGLGDIVIPGLFVALMLRHDVERRFASAYFPTAFWAYAGGVGTTILVMNVFKAAQPALLYIVPSILGALAVHSALKGEFGLLFGWKEAHVIAEEKAALEEEKKQKRAAVAEAKKGGGKANGGGGGGKKTK